MIRNEREYKEAVKRLQEERRRLKNHAVKLKDLGLAKKEIKRAMDPMRSFYEQFAEEVEGYEKLKRGEIPETVNLEGLGNTLVALRIARGITQRDLAERLGVHESQVSRDERNEYHGATIDRVSRILDALGAQMYSSFAEPVLPEVGL